MDEKDTVAIPSLENSCHAWPDGISVTPCFRVTTTTKTNFSTHHFPQARTRPSPAKLNCQTWWNGPTEAKNVRYDDVCLVRTDAPEGIRFQVLRIRPLCQHADWTRTRRANVASNREDWKEHCTSTSRNRPCSHICTTRHWMCRMETVESSVYHAYLSLTDQIPRLRCGHGGDGSSSLDHMTT